MRTTKPVAATALNRMHGNPDTRSQARERAKPGEGTGSSKAERHPDPEAGMGVLGKDAARMQIRNCRHNAQSQAIAGRSAAAIDAEKALENLFTQRRRYAIAI